MLGDVVLNFPSLRAPSPHLQSAYSAKNAIGAAQPRLGLSPLVRLLSASRVSPTRKDVRSPVVSGATSRAATLSPAAAETLPLLSCSDWRFCNVEDDYYIGKHLGSGAYGVVQRAISKSTGREVAIKCLLKRRAKKDTAKILQKIQAEVEFLTKLGNCSSVVTLHDVLQDDDRVYLVLELCQGGDIEQLLGQGNLSERQAAFITYECLKIIATCHSKGIVHGDVKPANFMIAPQLKYPLRSIEAGPEGSWLKAIDFGCSQNIAPCELLSKRTGTPIYMAPEVFKREYNASCDMWSCGMMLYQLISHRFPFWETMESCQKCTMEEVMRAVLTRDIPVNYGPWLSMSKQGLDLFSKMVARDPEERITAAEALEHNWFRMHFGWDAATAAAVRNNIVPLSPRAPVCSPLQKQRQRFL